MGADPAIGGWDAVAVQEEGLRRKSDAELPAWAEAKGHVLLTHNIRDFVMLCRQWVVEGRSHAGILVGHRAAFRELLGRASRFLSTCSAEEMRDRLDWLENYR